MSIVKAGDIVFSKTDKGQFGKAIKDSQTQSTYGYTKEVRELLRPRRNNWTLSHRYLRYDPNPTVESVSLLTRKGLAEW